jgi:hypothetical protein
VEFRVSGFGFDCHKIFTDFLLADSLSPSKYCHQLLKASQFARVDASGSPQQSTPVEK